MNDEHTQPDAGATPEGLLRRVEGLLQSVVERLLVVEAWQTGATVTLGEILPTMADRLRELAEGLNATQANLRKVLAPERRPPTGSGAGVN